MVKTNEIEDNRIDPLTLGYSILLTVLMICVVITALAGLYAGFILENEELLIYMADLCSNGIIWGVLFGLAVIVPAIIHLCESVNRYRNGTPTTDCITSVFIGFGNLALFLTFADISMALATAFVKNAGLDYTLNMNGLIAAQIIIVALYIGLYLTVFILKGKSAKKIINQKNFCEEQPEEQKTEVIQNGN